MELSKSLYELVKNRVTNELDAYIIQAIKDGYNYFRSDKYIADEGGPIERYKNVFTPVVDKPDINELGYDLSGIKEAIEKYGIDIELSCEEILQRMRKGMRDEIKKELKASEDAKKNGYHGGFCTCDHCMGN